MASNDPRGSGPWTTVVFAFCAASGWWIQVLDAMSLQTRVDPNGAFGWMGLLAGGFCLGVALRAAAQALRPPKPLPTVPGPYAHAEALMAALFAASLTADLAFQGSWDTRLSLVQILLAIISGLLASQAISMHATRADLPAGEPTTRP